MECGGDWGRGKIIERALALTPAQERHYNTHQRYITTPQKINQAYTCLGGFEKQARFLQEFLPPLIGLQGSRWRPTRK